MAYRAGSPWDAEITAQRKEAFAAYDCPAYGLSIATGIVLILIPLIAVLVIRRWR